MYVVEWEVWGRHQTGCLPGCALNGHSVIGLCQRKMSVVY